MLLFSTAVSMVEDLLCLKLYLIIYVPLHVSVLSTAWHEAKNEVRKKLEL